MKRASYREAVAWVALNDPGGDSDALDTDVVSGLITVCLVADVFDVDPIKVGKDVVSFRKTRPEWRERPAQGARITKSSPIESLAGFVNGQTMRILRDTGFVTVGELCERDGSELMDMAGFGKASLMATHAALLSLGLPGIRQSPHAPFAADVAAAKRHQRLLALLDSGKTTRELAALEGCSVGRIGTVLAAARAHAQRDANLIANAERHGTR